MYENVTCLFYAAQLSGSAEMFKELLIFVCFLKTHYYFYSKSDK